MELFSIVLILTFYNIVRSFFLTKKDYMVLSCGIIGFSGKRSANKDKLALLMLHNSLKRGEDNTGIYTAETGVIKKEQKAEAFLSDFQLPKSNMFIGHVRKASVGSKMEKNAHPFEGENIVLVHNGTLTSYVSLATSRNIAHTDYTTDTHLLSILLDQDSKQEKVTFDTLSQYEGAAALLFTDKRHDDILYAYRNDERPLYYGTSGSGMYISSLEESLKIIGCDKIGEFTPFYVHTIKDGIVIHSMYYKAKEKTVYNQYNNTRVTNVKYKDTKEVVSEFVTSARHANSLTSVELLDRWVKATMNLDCLYDGQRPKVTRDSWYYVIDAKEEITWDIKIKDDNGLDVWVNKFYFDAREIDYTSGYGVATMRIFDTQNPTKMLFNEGSVITLAPNSKVTVDGKIHCVHSLNDIIEVDAICVRPASAAERDKYIDERIEEFNTGGANNNDKSDDDCCIPPSTALAPSKVFTRSLLDRFPESIDQMEDEEEDDKHSPFEEYDAKKHQIQTLPDDEHDRLQSTTEEDYDIEEDEVVAVSHYILDKIDEIADDLHELAESTDWPELKLKSSELKLQINESYNTEYVKSAMESES